VTHTHTHTEFQMF